MNVDMFFLLWGLIKFVVVFVLKMLNVKKVFWNFVGCCCIYGDFWNVFWNLKWDNLLVVIFNFFGMSFVWKWILYCSDIKISLCNNIINFLFLLDFLLIIFIIVILFDRNNIFLFLKWIDYIFNVRIIGNNFLM